jgi:hypothetical protein
MRFYPPRRLGLALLHVLLMTGALSNGCGSRPQPGAIGGNDEISLFTNASARGPVIPEIRRLYAYRVDVVGPEAAFSIESVPQSRFSVYKTVKNQVYAVNLGARDQLAKALPGILGDRGKQLLDARKPFRLLLTDRFATGQTSQFAVAWNEPDLLRLFTEADSVELRRTYEDSVVRGLVETMFSLGEETELPAEVAREFGWTMRLNKGFFGAMDSARSFVKFNAAEPVRLILVHWLDETVPLTEEAWDPVMERILKVYNDGDFALAERTRAFPVSFQGEPALKWEGIWQNEKYTIGGPFRAFAFHRGRRSYILVGEVFAPGADKVYLLRQVEALMNTFRVTGP